MKQPDSGTPETAPTLLDLVNAVWRGTVVMVALLTALLVTVLWALVILLVKL